MNTTIKDRSAEASILIGHFSILPKGELTTYAEIEQLIGYDIRKNRGPIGTVKTRLRRDYGRVLKGVANGGYKVLTDEEVRQNEMRRDREHRRRHANNSKEKAQTVDISALSNDDKLALIGEMQVAHVVAAISTAKSVARVTSNMSGTEAGLLTLNKSLEALKKNLAKK